jgi:PadR family transcriptional regulator, regulatory protein PadR
MSKSRKQAEFLILMSLLDGAKHGYEISKYIEDRSNGFFRMPFGTLYPILHRLEKEDLVSVEIENGDSAKPKKIYKLTKAGRNAAGHEADEFHLYTRAISRMVPG